LLQGALGENTYSNTRFPESSEQYFAAQQQDIAPVCVIQPESPEEVSQTLNILREQECIFAIKSGGHSACTGASNIQDGVVVDLSKLNGIRVSHDESIVSVGTGSRWGKVYSTLEERGLLAVGGRAGSVGVGGFVLGGKLISISCYLWLTR
jgi:FAD/FMN-containing dehydrogenase